VLLARLPDAAVVGFVLWSSLAVGGKLSYAPPCVFP
jgi:hypothetical protein